MLEQAPDADYVKGKLEYPYGRGMNLQMLVPDVEALAIAFKDSVVIRPLMNKTYQTGAVKSSFRELMIADPDGYVLRFQQIL